MASFIDRVVLHVSAGNGGHGCASIHREKFRPLGGPDGGNGGEGGAVTLVVDRNTHTLLDFHFHPHATAGHGRPGQGNHRSGANGEDLILKVPDGTVVLDETGTELADLVGVGTEFVVVQGGRGGLGNAALASPRRKAPGFALLGERGETRDVTLELKSVADVGLVGFPSAGKSSLIAVISAARPKIADYPFTTLVPNLGVVTVDGATFTVADVPGLIPGAATGKGLGLEFLRHIERCAVLLHVVDTATLEPDRDPLSDIEAIEAELTAYGGLEHLPRLVALNKVDIPDAQELATLVRPELEQRFPDSVFEISTITRDGLRPLQFALAATVATAREQAAAEVTATRIVLRPTAVDDAGFTVKATAEGFTVRGTKPERWVRQTDFTNEEAVGFLADRLARLGVEEALANAGATAGASVTIGDVSFDWEPAIAAGGALKGRRGTDPRLAEVQRLAAERET